MPNYRLAITNILSNNFRGITFNPSTSFQKLLNLYSSFTLKWMKKYNLTSQIFSKISITSSNITLNQSFFFVDTQISYSSLNSTSIYLSSFCFIFNTSSSTPQINYIISKESSPTLYSLIRNNKASQENLDSYISNSILHYKTLLLNLNSIPPLYISSSRSISRKSSIKIIEYAEKHALDYNPLYISFDKNGGDCTNFVSQALTYGGISNNYTWKPYTNSWLRVNELRDYLIYNKIASESNQISLTSPGSIIQFYHKDKKIWTHSGIITYLRENHDCLYCCHSYDKLNFPLSLVYPSIYPKFRILTPFY